MVKAMTTPLSVEALTLVAGEDSVLGRNKMREREMEKRITYRVIQEMGVYASRRQSLLLTDGSSVCQ